VRGSYAERVGLYGKRALCFALLAVACGARSELLAPTSMDASIDVRDSGRDAQVDAPRDVAPDVIPADVVLPDAPPPALGCSDGTREGFASMAMFPSIAGCSGGFQIPGVMPFDPGTAPACPTLPTFGTVAPACNRIAGNDSPNPDGVGCDVEDLCAVGWHVCASAIDIANCSPSGCDGATTTADPPLFFASRQSSDGCTDCATGTSTAPDCDSKSCATGCQETADTSNDVFGCGNFGTQQTFTGCGPIDRFSNDLCSGLAGSSWSCQDDGSGLCEAFAVVHTDASYGGVLCCID
jgi:hypothetical protein